MQCSVAEIVQCSIDWSVQWTVQWTVEWSVQFSVQWTVQWSVQWTVEWSVQFSMQWTLEWSVQWTVEWSVQPCGPVGPSCVVVAPHSRCEQAAAAPFRSTKLQVATTSYKNLQESTRNCKKLPAGPSSCLQAPYSCQLIARDKALLSCWGIPQEHSCWEVSRCPPASVVMSASSSSLVVQGKGRRVSDMSCVLCHLSCVMCHVSCVRGHLPRVMCPH